MQPISMRHFTFCTHTLSLHRYLSRLFPCSNLCSTPKPRAQPRNTGERVPGQASATQLGHFEEAGHGFQMYVLLVYTIFFRLYDHANTIEGIEDVGVHVSHSSLVEETH